MTYIRHTVRTQIEKKLEHFEVLSFKKKIHKKNQKNRFWWWKKKLSIFLQNITESSIFVIFWHLHDEKTSIFSKLFEFLKIFYVCLFPTKIWVKIENSFIFGHIFSNMKISWETDKLKKIFFPRENMKDFV